MSDNTFPKKSASSSPDRSLPTALPRRKFLAKTVALTGALPLAGAAALNSNALAQNAPAAAPPVAAAPVSAASPQPLIGYASFSLDEATFVEALVDHMCPADDLTPGGVDCGLAVFIDRQLAGSWGQGARHYMRGPWRKGTPQHGYQTPMTPEQFFKAGIALANEQSAKKFGKRFAELDDVNKETFLQEVAGGKIADSPVSLAYWFNELVYPLFQQACYADPLYGGNVGKVFWKMIGYPGLPATNTRNMVEFRGKPFPGAKTPKSIADFS